MAAFMHFCGFDSIRSTFRAEDDKCPTGVIHEPTAKCVSMGILSRIFLCYFSQPKAERQLYRAAAGTRASRIVEIGLGTGRRARRVIEISRCYHPAEQIHYTGIDWFEARPESQPTLRLKQAFQMLRPVARTLQLIPGDPRSALARAANGLVGSDLIVISADYDESDLANAWFYFPRMLHPGTVVLREDFLGDSQETRFERISHDEIAKRAQKRQTNLLRAA